MSNPNQKESEDSQYYQTLAGHIIIASQQQQQAQTSTIQIAQQLEQLRQSINNNYDAEAANSMITLSLQAQALQQLLASSAAPVPSPAPVPIAPPYPEHVTFSPCSSTNNSRTVTIGSTSGTLISGNQQAQSSENKIINANIANLLKNSANASSLQQKQPQPQVQPQQSMSRTLNEREQFFCFVKVLLKLFEQADDDRLKAHCKLVIRDCTLRNRRGDPDCTPLVSTLHKRLRPVIGERYWRRAETVLRRSLEQKAAREREAATAIPTAV